MEIIHFLPQSALKGRPVLFSWTQKSIFFVKIVALQRVRNCQKQLNLHHFAQLWVKVLMPTRGKKVFFRDASCRDFRLDFVIIFWWHLKMRMQGFIFWIIWSILKAVPWIKYHFRNFSKNVTIHTVDLYIISFRPPGENQKCWNSLTF